jgi:hypothetical protein
MIKEKLNEGLAIECILDSRINNGTVRKIEIFSKFNKLKFFVFLKIERIFHQVEKLSAI